MNKQTVRLLERHFDTAFAAPDGIKKLRELILALAMQGKLVAQEPQDQPASVLLKEIEAEKRRLVKAGKIKTPKPLSEITPEEVPYELPDGWEWVRLGGIGVIGSSSRVHQKDWRERGIPFYRAREIVKLSRYGFVDNDLFIAEELYESLTAGGLTPMSGDLMITGVGTIGVPYIVKEDDRFYFKDASVLIFKNHFGIFPFYLLQFFMSPFWNSSIHKESMGTTVHTLTIVRANETLIPLPPLAEQRRIVAKIDQLMARCDELEKLRAEREQKRLTVHTAALVQLLEASSSSFPRRRESSPSEPLDPRLCGGDRLGREGGVSFARARQFLARHFGELYSVKENVAELRKAILQLAVMGKLVPQAPQDQPASALLQEIKVEKRRLVQAGKIKAPKPLPEIRPEEVPYALPKGWEWVRLGKVGAFERGRSKHRPRNDKRLFTDGTYPFVQTGDVSKAKQTNNEITTCGSYYNEYGLQQSRLWEQGTLCITIAANIAETGFLGMDACIPDSVVAFLSLDESLSKFVKVFIDVAKEDLEHYAPSTAQKNINLGIINELTFPLPPLSEQHRIVAKIDQLMALCDELDKQIAAATGQQTALLNAVMAQV